MRGDTSLRLVLVAILSSVVAERGSTQSTTAADGPWAGWAQCQLTVQGEGYANQQTHTWVLTGTTPTVEGAFRLYPATWTVTGKGSRQRVMGDGRTVVEQWTTAGQPLRAPISVWIRGSDATLRFTSRHAQLRSQAAATGTSTARSTKGNAPDQTTQIAYDVYEWTFPAIEDVPTTNTTVGGSSTRPLIGSIAPGQPPGTASTEACSWRFVQGATVALLPPGPDPTATPSSEVALRATAPGGMIQVTPSTTTEFTPKAAAANRTLSPNVTSALTEAMPPTNEGTTATIDLKATPAGPAPTGLAVTGSGITATIKWQGPDTWLDVANFVVTRWGQTSPVCCKENSGPLGNGRWYWTDAGLLWPGTYVYRVTANYRDGRVGSAEIQFTRLTQDPTGFSAQQTGEGEVRLSWKAVAGVTTYLVGGPGAGSQGLQVNGTSTTLSGVPPGPQEWTVASLYTPGGLLTPWENWPKASFTLVPGIRQIGPALSGSIEVIFAAVPGATTYVLKRGSSLSGPFTAVARLTVSLADNQTSSGWSLQDWGAYTVGGGQTVWYVIDAMVGSSVMITSSAPLRMDLPSWFGGDLRVDFAKTGADQYTINWESVNGALQYIVSVRSELPGAYGEPYSKGGIQPGQTQISINGVTLLRGVKYTVLVIADVGYEYKGSPLRSGITFYTPP